MNRSVINSIIYNYKNYNFAIALLFFFIDKNLKLILTLRPHRPILFHVEKYAKDIQGDSPLENPLPKSRATAVRVATLLNEPYCPLHSLCAEFWQGISIHASDEQWRKPGSLRTTICYQICTEVAGDL